MGNPNEDGEKKTSSGNHGSTHSLHIANGGSQDRVSMHSKSTSLRQKIGNRLLEFIRMPYALFILSERNPIRRLSKNIVEHKLFEYFILLNIVANCVVLAMNKPLPMDDKIEIAKDLEHAEVYFVAIFCIEATLKILALGFVLHPGSYLRNGWNILDFVVVVIGVISLPNVDIKTDMDIKSLRAVRVLRPVKLISGVPSLQVVMKSIGRAMVPLLQIALLVLFVIVIYAIIGLEFLMKQFHTTCFRNSSGVMEMTPGPSPCDKGPYFGVRQVFHGRQCSGDYPICDEFWVGPNNGISTFDNIALSMLTVFQCITMEGWTGIMYSTFEAIDRDGYLYSVYFVSLIVIGSFFMLNLVLGVLSGEFAKERERVETRRAFFKVRRQQQLDRQVAGYLDWITKADEILIREKSRRESISTVTADTESQAQVISQDTSTNQTSNDRLKQSCMDRFSIEQQRLKLLIRKSVKSQWFYWTVLICVFLNTISLATEHYNQPIWLDEFQDKAEKVFLAIFTLEMVLKMYSLGFDVYFSSSFNVFDCVVVCSGLVEAVLDAVLDQKINLGLSVLRCVRLLRVFKVTRHWKSLRNLATSLVSSIKSIMSLIFLLFLFILISALLGMQIFGGKFIGETKNPRTNFDNFPNAMLTVFQILTGEDWNSVMSYGIMAYGGPKTTWGLVVSLYFVLLVIVGNYTLLNVFLAIAVDNLANAQILTQDEEQEEELKERKKSEHHEKFLPPPPPAETDLRQSKWRKAKPIPVVLAIKNFVRDNKQANGDQLEFDGPPNVGNRRTDRRFSAALGKKIQLYRLEENQTENRINEDGPDGGQSDTGDGSTRKRRVRERRGGRRRTTDKKDSKQNEEDDDEDDQPITAKNFMNVLHGGRLGNRRRRGLKTVQVIRTRTLFIFGPDNGFRKLCHSIVNLAHFDTAMLVVIGLSSLTIAAEDPLRDDAPRNNILWYFDCVFTAIFAFEVVVKVVDLGLILHKGAYLRNTWNIIDAIVVICNIASLVLSKNDVHAGLAASWIKALRVVRVLRPFKSVHKIKKLQAVFRCMWFSVKNVANILMITGLFLLIFAVIGVQLFNGKFWKCTDEAKLYEKECQGHFFKFKYDKHGVPVGMPTVEERKWEKIKLNFDNVGEAMLTLYTSSTGEGWPTAMHRTMDTTEKDKGPIQDYSTEYAIFYVSFVVVFSFFFLNIFVALIILTFQDLGEKEISNCELDRNQRDCIHFALSAKPAQFYMPRNKHSFQYKVWLVASSRPLDIFIMVLIALNSVVLMMQYYGQSDQYEKACQYLNIAFTSMFTLEAAIKITALRLNYFRDYWNLFDFFIVLGGLLDMAFTIVAHMSEQANSNNGKSYMPIDPSMFRLFRAARLIKLLRQGYTIRILLWTFLRSFKALPYVTLLIMLQFFMYAVIGMQLFGKIALDDDTEINSHNNFRDIFQALQGLFRAATGEDWHLVMTACFSDAKCDKLAGISTGCGSTPLAIIYFCSFIFLCMFLMLNLFVAVIMDNFEYLTRDESILGPHHLDEFVRVWSEYDPAATGFIHHSEVYKMMCSMSPPVGFGKKCPRIVGYKRLIKMNMPLDENGKVTFSTTLFALIRISLNIKLRGNMNANDTELRKLISRLWPNSTSPKVLDKLIPKQSVLSSQQMTIGKIYCAKLIHENYKYSKKKEDSGFQSGLLRRIVGSIRGKGRHSDRISAPSETDSYDQNFLSPRLRSRTSEEPNENSIPRKPVSKKSSDHSSSLVANSIARSHSWSSQANGDIEMSESILRDNLNPASSPSLRNGQARKEEKGMNGPVIPMAYLTSTGSPNPQRKRKNDPHRTIDHSSVHRASRDTVRTGRDGHKPQAPNPTQSRDRSRERPRDQPRDDKYYDDMIVRINEELEQAVKKGQSPYDIYGLEEDDASEWC
ncbi:voltage-dependent calcium channel type A subunit alpha-1-like isoform X2 [Nematostella vectensis]|uniref:voltage-dependent calcium channel type A subunit alpha-1-like isoform X2 n=1 Tax=Nematostella vectensis TaxID=45351 RepID=UPI002076FD95|nr:voltage-dependent calcium channel type A subunit alpha-1-like isoform X2 [Nematostella vectensis]